MPTRDEVYVKHGPILLEAVCCLFLEEINQTRAKLNMPLLTIQEVIDKLNNNLNELQPYDWMS